MTLTLTPVTLTGTRVVLEPLSHDHHDGLVDAVRDGELWKLWYTTVPSPEGMRAEIDRRLRLQEAGSMLPFTTRLLDSETNAPGRIIGMTTYMEIDRATPRLEIGFTWSAASSHGTGTNPDSKLLLLEHAFEVFGCMAVEFRTNWMNLQSREAIARLGAKQDGVLRSHTRTADGTLRDTVVFSIIESEWASVRAGLRRRIEKVRG
jgi:RimJ/RimL family protein N-acetyltransferase